MIALNRLPGSAKRFAESVMANKIRILVADDHALVRKSICALLDKQPDMEIVATAENGKEAVMLAAQTKPDVIVMDVSMPVVDGIEATEKIRSENTVSSIVILSMHVSNMLVERALQKGAQAYVLKRYATQDLPQAIRAVINGEVFLSAAISS